MCASFDCIARNASCARLVSVTSIRVPMSIFGLELCVSHRRRVAMAPYHRAVLASVLLHSLVMMPPSLLELSHSLLSLITVFLHDEVQRRELPQFGICVTEHGLKRRFVAM